MRTWPRLREGLRRGNTSYQGWSYGKTGAVDLVATGDRFGA